MLLLLLFSCQGTPEDEFQVQRRNLRNNSQINVTQEPENYYYQAPGVRSGGYVPQPVPAQPAYYYQPVPVQPYVPSSYQVPGSRFYSNPYAIPPASNYQRYDIDQYYVPPTRYQNIERQPSGNSFGSSGADGKQ